MLVNRRTAVLHVLASAAARGAPAADAVARAVAITLDDLPRGGDWPRQAAEYDALVRMTRRLTGHFRRARLPFAGFVNGGSWPDLDTARFDRVLRLWLDAGAELGNHSFTHPSLNNTTLADYCENVRAGHQALQRTVPRPRYFRHPFLHAGPTEEKRRGLEEFLNSLGYRIAPVTLDNSDYLFAALYGRALRQRDRALAARVRAAYVPYLESITSFFEDRSREVFGREFPQILLLHANQLNADEMPALLAMFRRRGYRFVTLHEALADPIYQSEDRYFGPHGFSWIHRWTRTKGLPNRGEPAEPAWIQQTLTPPAAAAPSPAKH